MNTFDIKQMGFGLSAGFILAIVGVSAMTLEGVAAILALTLVHCWSMSKY